MGLSRSLSLSVLPGLLKRQVNKREFLKRDPEAQNIVNTLDDRPDEFKTTPAMKETEVETVEKQEVGAEDTPFLVDDPLVRFSQLAQTSFQVSSV
jgi:hypothetical protein